MDLKINKEELAEFFSNVFDVMLSPEAISVESEPFSLVIGGVPVEKIVNWTAPQVPSQRPAVEAQEDFMSLDDAIGQSSAAEEAPEPEGQSVPPGDGILSYDELLARNAQLQQKKTATPRVGMLDPESQVAHGRVLGPNEFDEAPPVTEDELRGHTGGRHHG